MADISEKKVRPEKPDEAKFKQELAELEKVLNAAQAKFNAVKSKFDSAKTSKDSPAMKRKYELIQEKRQIQHEQAELKESRGSTKEKITAIEEKRNDRLKELKTAKGSIGYRTTKEIDDKIAELDAGIESGKMKIVDEKKALDEIRKLKLTKKAFADFERQEKTIKEFNDKITELKQANDNPEAKTLSERFNAINKELDEITASQQEGQKNFTSLREEVNKAHEIRESKYQAVKAYKDKYYADKRDYAAYNAEAKKAYAAKVKAENESYQKEKRKAAAAERLEEASQLAYYDEIVTAETLIHYFDPKFVPETKPLRGPSGFAASSGRTVDDTGIKGTALTKKDDRDDTYFAGTGGKKGKKGRKEPAAETSKYNLSLGVIEQLAKIDVEAPTKQSEVEAVVTKLKEKVAKWKSNQESKTKENIAKAQAEIDRLEAEAVSSTPEGSHDSAKKPSLANSGVNGKPSAEAELAQEEEAVKDATKELEAAQLDD